MSSLTAIGTKEKYSKILNLFQEGDTNEFKELNSGDNSENIGLIIRTITSSKTNYVPKNNKSWWHEAIEYCQNIILYQIVPKAPVITKKSRAP